MKRAAYKTNRPSWPGRIHSRNARRCFDRVGQSQLVLFNSSTTTPITAQFEAVRVGSDKSIFAVLVSNALVLLLAIFETIRTKVLARNDSL